MIDVRWGFALLVMMAWGCSEAEYGITKADEGVALDTADPGTTPPDPTTPDTTTPPIDTAPPVETEEPVELPPDILVSPLILDFGPVEGGATAEGMFTISNVGEGPLWLGEPTVETTGEFDLDAPSLIEIGPGESVDTFVEFTPSFGLSEGRVLIPSDDPDTPIAEVELRGSLMEPDLPTAVCSVSPSRIEAIHESATWIGSGSTDPDGRPLTYEWTLVARPPGATASMPGGAPTNSDRSGFVPDVVGFYRSELVVTNDIGVSSAPCVAELEAIPAADLWVEMFWTRSGDDMDLHLTRDGGRLRTGQDCYYANCRTSGLSWGPGGADGDPVLDIDDIADVGPENVNIDRPEDTHYQVWVHDYPGSVRTAGNDVTVRIYLAGVLEWEDTRTISGEDSETPFADIDWASRSVMSL
jgi:hypothetical protein